jgi:hypothetical protein
MSTEATRLQPALALPLDDGEWTSRPLRRRYRSVDRFPAEGVASGCSIQLVGEKIMLRRLLTTAGVAGIVAFVVGGGAFAVASGSGSDGPVKTITVTEKSGPGHFVDLGKKGFSIGDEFTFNSVFWNTAQTTRVGSNHGYCVVLTKRLSHCVGTARLMGGTIEFAGNVAESSDFRIAVIGGTGPLKGAEGQVSIHNLNPDGSLSRDVIELIG